MCLLNNIIGFFRWKKKSQEEIDYERLRILPFSWRYMKK